MITKKACMRLVDAYSTFMTEFALFDEEYYHLFATNDTSIPSIDTQRQKRRALVADVVQRIAGHMAEYRKSAKTDLIERLLKSIEEASNE